MVRSVDKAPATKNVIKLKLIYTYPIAKFITEHLKSREGGQASEDRVLFCFDSLPAKY